MDELQARTEMDEIIGDFLFESKELIEKAINDTLNIEENPDPDLINSIFRAIHTLKGTSSFLGFNNFSTLAHRTEDVLGKLRKNELHPDTQTINVLLQAMDLLKEMLTRVEQTGNDGMDVDPMLRALEELLDGKKTKRLGEMLLDQNLLSQDQLTKALERQRKEPEKRLGEILVEERLITEGQLENLLERQRRSKEDEYVRINVKKLDELMNLVGELTLGKNRLLTVECMLRAHSSKNGELDMLSDCVSYIESITNELQISVMKTRLIPLSKILNKVPRMVRDLAREFQKEIDVRIEGQETELDRSLVEALESPLVHIVRNSVDHGIEKPEERERKGKNRRGLIHIRAYNEGGHVVLEIADDGRGIEVAALKEKVREKGLLSEKDLQGLSDKEALNLIFIPGLSTAKTTTSVSGRGVGMDVVKTNVERMNGSIHVESERDKGTRLVLRLPLTLAILKTLVVGAAREVFAIPLHSIMEIVKLTNESVRELDKKEVLVLRDEIIPLIDLSALFFGQNGEKRGYAIICHTGERKIGVRVDTVLGQEEAVIKSLGGFLRRIEGISGATIRGDGRVVLILDIGGLIGTYRTQHLRTDGSVSSPFGASKGPD